MSEIPVDEEREAAILREIIMKKKYPTNPLKIINEFKKLKKDQIIKLSICGVIVVLFAIFNNVNILGNPIPDNQCYYDVLHEWAKPLNNFYRGNKVYRTIVTIMGSICIDIVYCIIAIYILIIGHYSKHFANKNKNFVIIKYKCNELKYFERSTKQLNKVIIFVGECMQSIGGMV